MIIVVRWCEVSMTLFHHLKLKRPRMNSNDHTPSMSQQHTPNLRKKAASSAIGNGSSDPAAEDGPENEIVNENSGGKESSTRTGADASTPTEDPPVLDCDRQGSADDNDTSAMPQLERQNSVFDGGGGAPHPAEGRDVLPHLSPQLWPPSNTLAYHRHFGPPDDEEDGVGGGEPPPLLMGDVVGRGNKTMVWTRSPSMGGRGRVPPTATITSPTLSKRPPSPGAASPSPSPTATSQTFEPSTAQSLYRQSGKSFSMRGSPDEEASSLVSWSLSPDPSSSQSMSPDTQALNLSVASTSRDSTSKDDDGQPMVCMICEDRATGLHYGIITCEGCKGFFKRTVQNKRVYTCVAEGNCEVTKAQRNRCQYCRFQKCVRQGMVLAAVREDRMPGGRNSGAVYNLYKVKYKKHRRGQKNGHVTQEPPSAPSLTTTATATPNQRGVFPSGSGPLHQEWANGQILKTALTSPADVIHLRHRTENCVTSSGGGAGTAALLRAASTLSEVGGRMSQEQATAMIRQLVECEAFEDVAKLKNAKELLQCKMELNDKLCHIGDNIVYKLVQWTKRLPFYHELPVAVHTQLLTHKWQELLVLTTCAFQAIRGSPPTDVTQAVASALCSLRECLTIMVGVPVGLEELREAGPLVERLALLADSFRRMGLCFEEYVCLKVLIMQSPDEIKDQKELEAIHERYMTALRVFVEHRFPQQATRFAELLSCIPEIQAAASLVVQSKMFYVPLFLNTSLNK